MNQNMHAVLDQLRWEGFEVKSEDVARLAPLNYKHFNFLGRYSFNLAEPVARIEYKVITLQC